MTAVGPEVLIGAGGLIKNDNGSWMVGFYSRIGLSDILAAELWGVWEGLNLARDRGLRKIELEFDSESLVKLLSEGVDKEKKKNRERAFGSCTSTE
ncbi:Ribonuclease H domain [Dillenia turbinata]|uniref:Ribonuclease H domain n=1 Tax=Dillenia turbinata TaxID=194707 RepID=A0AAN8URL6_9MAGN